jgi:hypothetical protein
VGAPRIDGELLKLGIGILEASSQLSIDGMDMASGYCD